MKELATTKTKLPSFARDLQLGQKFKSERDTFVLARISLDSHPFSLINIGSGNRWTEPARTMEEAFAGEMHQFQRVSK